MAQTKNIKLYDRKDYLISTYREFATSFEPVYMKRCLRYSRDLSLPRESKVSTSIPNLKFKHLKRVSAHSYRFRCDKGI